MLLYERERERDRDRERERERERVTGETDRQTDRQTDGQSEGEVERQRMSDKGDNCEHQYMWKCRQITLTPLPNDPEFYRPRGRELLKTRWKRNELLVTDIFSFSGTVFYYFCHI